MRPTMRTMRVLCPLSLLLGAACGPGDAVSFPTSMSLNACDEHIIVADLPPDAARRNVDVRYTPTINSRGQAVGFISTYRCDQVGVGDRNYPAGFLSYFSIVLDIPPGLPNDDDDLHQYVLWATTNQPALEQAFERAGVPVYRADDVTLRLDATTRNTTVEHGGTVSPFTATTTVEMTYDEPGARTRFLLLVRGLAGPGRAGGQDEVRPGIRGDRGGSIPPRQPPGRPPRGGDPPARSHLAAQGRHGPAHARHDQHRRPHISYFSRRSRRPRGREIHSTPRSTRVLAVAKCPRPRHSAPVVSPPNNRVRARSPRCTTPSGFGILRALSHLVRRL